MHQNMHVRLIQILDNYHLCQSLHHRCDEDFIMVAPQHIDKLGNFLPLHSHHDQVAVLFRNGVDQDSQDLEVVLFAQGYDFVKSAYSFHDGDAEKYALAVGSYLGDA